MSTFHWSLCTTAKCAYGHGDKCPIARSPEAWEKHQPQRATEQASPIKPKDQTIYVVEFQIGGEGPDGQTQEARFNFLKPPPKDDVIKAVNKHIESQTKDDYKKEAEWKAEFGAALLDYFKYVDESDGKLWSEDIVYGLS